MAAPKGSGRNWIRASFNAATRQTGIAEGRGTPRTVNAAINNLRNSPDPNAEALARYASGILNVIRNNGDATAVRQRAADQGVRPDQITDIEERMRRVLARQVDARRGVNR